MKTTLAVIVAAAVSVAAVAPSQACLLSLGLGCASDAADRTLAEAARQKRLGIQEYDPQEAARRRAMEGMFGGSEGLESAERRARANGLIR